MVVSFIGGGNRNTQRKPQTCRKALTNLLILLYKHFDKKWKKGDNTDILKLKKKVYLIIVFKTI